MVVILSHPDAPIRRLRVRYDKLAFVFPVPQEHPERPERVRQLIQLLEQRISAEIGTHVRIPAIRTEDGYDVSAEDRVVEVFRDSEAIIAMNMASFMTVHRPLLDTSEGLWLELERDDYADSVPKWARVGAHKHGKVYVQLGKGNSAAELHLIQIADLKKFLRGRQDAQAIGTVEDEKSGKWFVEARLMRIAKDRAAVAVSVKVSSERQIWSDQVELKIEGLKIVPGPVTHLSGVEGQDDDGVDVDYSALIPEPKHTGPSLDINDRPVLVRHESQGTSQIDMVNGAGDDDKLQNFVVVNSDSWVRDGKWHQYLSIPAITFSNRSDKTLSVVSMKADYQDQEGQWQACTGVTVGTSYVGRWGPEFEWIDDGTTFSLQAGVSLSFAVRAAILMSVGKPGMDNYRRARLHDSLPQPLRLRVTIRDIEGKERSLIIEAANAPLDVPTKEKQEEYWNVTIDSFVFADDVEAQGRLWFALYRPSAEKEEDQKKEVIFRFSHGTYYTYTKKDFKALEFKAADEGIEELRMDNMCRKESSGNEWAVTALFDKNNGYKMYALRILVQSPTSSTEEVVLLPPLK